MNGDFSSGVIVVGNGDFPPSTVPNWSTAFGTPQVTTAMGCDNSGFIKMWGNQGVGEGIRQMVNIQAGHRYRLSACVRVDTSNSALPNYVRFNVRASDHAITYTETGPTAPAIGVLGTPTNTPSVPAPGITSTAWVHLTLADWVAPASFDRITINPENDNTAVNGNMVSWGWIDSICLQEVFPPDFTATTVCEGQPTTFTTSTAGASSWNWDFGDGTTSTLQNPTHTYPSWGSFPAKLCINGTTNCVTKQITVKGAPLVPVINGPANVYGGQTATYSINPPPNHVVSWTVTNGTINGAANQNSVSVTWNASGGGVISVTVTNKGGCSSTARMSVGSDLFLGDCCHGLETKTDLTTFTHTGGGVYNFTPTVSVTLQGVIRITADVIGVSQTFSAPSCGTSGPANSSVVSAANAGGFVATVPIAGGHEVIWHGPPTNVTGLSLPMQIKFPPPPGGKCTDLLTFCVKYTFTTKDCKTCEVIRCYGPFKRGGLTINSENLNIRVKTKS